MTNRHLGPAHRQARRRRGLRCLAVARTAGAAGRWDHRHLGRHTADNQEVYPQMASQHDGLGFPIMRLVGLLLWQAAPCSMPPAGRARARAVTSRPCSGVCSTLSSRATSYSATPTSQPIFCLAICHAAGRPPAFWRRGMGRRVSNPTMRPRLRLFSAPGA